jgi:hypothetical protein
MINELKENTQKPMSDLKKDVNKQMSSKRIQTDE